MSFETEAMNASRLFELLGARERRMLVETSGAVRLAAQECLFQIGEPGGTMYVVASGAVEIYIKDTTGEKILLKRAETGDFFGEISLFDGRARSATAVAACESELLALRREDLIRVFQQHPETAIGMLAALGAMLRETDKMLQAGVARNANEMMERELSAFERAADWMAWFSGSLPFLALTAVWFVAWIAVNALPLGITQFDPFPFGLLTMIVSLESIFLSCFVLISQNRQTEKDRLRTDIEYDVNIKAEMEVAHLHEKTDRLTEQMHERLARIEKLLTEKA